MLRELTPRSGNTPPKSHFTLGRGSLFLALLVLALLLRYHDLGKYPKAFQTSDEYHYLWAGLTLLDTGHPQSLTILKSYENVGAAPKKIRLADGSSLRLVTPALDHPPLFSITAAIFARLAGAQRIEVVQPDGSAAPTWQFDLRRARLLTLFLFTAAFVLLFAIATTAFSFEIACLTTLFYAVIPHIVFHGRLLVTENMTVVLLLLNIYAVQRYQNARIGRFPFALITIASIAAALLCKVVAVSQAAVVIFLLLYYGKRRDLVFPLLGVALGALLYMAYGWWQGWDIFTAVLAEQSKRFYGFDALSKLVAEPLLVHDANRNYLLMVGWGSCFAAMFLPREGVEKPSNEILAAPLVYLIAFVFFTSVPGIWGWHAVPFYPFLCLALAVLIHRVYQSGRPLEFIAFLAIFLPIAFDFIPGLTPRFESSVLRYIYLFAAGAVCLLAIPENPFRQISQRLLIFSVTALLIFQQAYASWFRHYWR